MVERRKSLFDWNHVSDELTEDQISELKALYKFYHKKHWIFKMTFKSFQKAELACNIGSVVLVIIGTIVGSVTLNAAILGYITGAGVLLKQL